MLSLCILSYNRMGFLKEAIGTAVASADEPLEVIVHDDGSTELSLPEFLMHLVKQGTVSHVILNPPGHNEGQGIAVNRMFAMAKGDILVKADQDLIFKDGWTRAIRDILEANEGSGIDPDGPPAIGALGLFKYHHPPVQHDDMYEWTHDQDGVEWDQVTDFCGSLIAVPRKAWEAFGPWEERSAAFAEDNDFKRRITDNPVWCCALTPEDYVTNQGFGIGPSTVVPAAGQVAEIKDGPKLVQSKRVERSRGAEEA